MSNTLEDYENLIPSQNRQKPKFMGTMKALVNPLVYLQDLSDSLVPAFDVDYAVGAQLDVVGLWVGVSRFIRSPLSGIYFEWAGSVKTFISRASTGTFIGSNGLIETAAINVARMQYIPSLLSYPPALLTEISKTNVDTYSDDFTNAVWTKTACSIAMSAIADMYGSGFMQTLVEDNTTASHTLNRNRSFIAGTYYTISTFVKLKDRQYCRLNLSTTAFGGNTSAYFDLVNGAVKSVSNGEAGMIALPNGIYRIWYTALCTVTTASGQASLAPSVTGAAVNYLGDGVSGIYCKGSQVEEGQLTSYIPTVASTVTRAADIYSEVLTGQNVGWGKGVWKGEFSPTSGLTSLPDDIYRLLIRAKIAANRWDGSIPGAYEIWETIFTDNQIVIQDKQNMTMVVGVVGEQLDALTQALLTGGYIPLKPEGVRVAYYAIPNNTGPLFVWNGEDDNNVTAGWNVGSWANLVTPT